MFAAHANTRVSLPSLWLSRGRTIERRQLLQRLRAEGGRPNVRLMNAVVEACRKGRQWEKALEILAEMKELGVTPDYFTYSAAITACRQGGQWEKVGRGGGWCCQRPGLGGHFFVP